MLRASRAPSITQKLSSTAGSGGTIASSSSSLPAGPVGIFAFSLSAPAAGSGGFSLSIRAHRPQEAHSLFLQAHRQDVASWATASALCRPSRTSASSRKRRSLPRWCEHDVNTADSADGQDVRRTMKAGVLPKILRLLDAHPEVANLTISPWKMAPWVRRDCILFCHMNSCIVELGMLC